MRDSLSFALPALLVVATAVHGGEGEPRGQRSALTSFPTPPRQAEPWKPPKCDVPIAQSDVAGLLFDLGLADPRGCEYRAIKVQTRVDARLRGEPLPARGWVLPATVGEKQRFAICWDGLVHPVASVGDRADLKRDVLAALERATQGEGDTVAPAVDLADSLGLGPGPWSLPLLLRLGEGDLAERVWKSPLTPETEAEADQLRTHAIDRFIVTLFSSGSVARMVSDDRLALVRLRQLDRLLKELKKRNLEKADGGNWAPYWFEALRADQERRMKKPREPIVCVGPGRHPDAGKRIVALIERLDEVADMPCAFGLDHILHALESEGERALEPLLRCMETDDRLTRSIGYPTPFSERWYWVHEAAERAAHSILDQQGYFFDADEIDKDLPDKERRKKVAAAMRAELAKKNGATPAERWFNALADDRAPPRRWASAAYSITVDRGTEAGSVGELLRKRKNPSVSDLLRKRLDTTSDLKAVNSLASALADWEGKAALPILRKLSGRLLEGGEHKGYRELLQVRARLDDPQLFDDYTPWLLKQSPVDLSTECLEPLVRLPRHPGTLKITRALFGDVTSEWRQAFTGEEKDATRVVLHLLQSPLLSSEPFRDYVRELLSRKDLVGTAVLNNKAGGLKCQGPREVSFEHSGYRDPEMPEGKIEVEYRLCDLVAHHIAGRIEAAPRCELYWPIRRREQGVKACLAFLKRYGDRLTAEDGIVFPVLDRPATAEDVAAGRAIFSLTGQGKAVRRVTLPLPLAGRWTTLRETPDRNLSFMLPPVGPIQGSVHYLQQGTVWQAEEVDEGGRWVRYYGFAGAHRLARVPAEEIEFADPNRVRLPFLQPWADTVAVGRHFRMWLVLPSPPALEDAFWPRRFAAAAPVLFQPTLFNSSGLNASPPPADKLPRWKLWYSPETITAVGELAPAAEEDGSWVAIPFRPGAPSIGFSRKNEVTPAVSVTGEAIDLRKMFTIDRPGFYRLVLEPVDGKGEQPPCEVTFSVSPAERMKERK